MNFLLHIPKTFHDELEDLFQGFYHTASLRGLYDTAVAPTLGLKVERKAPSKAAIVKEIMSLVGDPDRMATFLGYLPSRLRQTVQILLWVEKMSLPELEEAVGKSLVDLTEPNTHRYHREPVFTLKDGFDLLVLWTDLDYYPSQEELKDRANYRIALPPALRALFKPYFPKPDGYNLTGSPDLPAQENKGWRQFECSQQALQDMVVMADFVRRGGVSRTKTGSLARSCLRKLTLVTSGLEPYPESGCSLKLPFFRHEFMVAFVECLSEGDVAGLADATTAPAVFLRRIPDYLGGAPTFVGHHLLPYLKSEYGGNKFAKGGKALRAFLEIFEQMGLGEWLTRKQIFTYCSHRDLDGCFFSLSDFRFDAVPRKSKGWRSGRWQSIRRDERMDVVTWPLFSGLALGLASLGLVEVAYTDPTNDLYSVGSHSFLSPFEGVKAVRLTALGAYAFGVSEILDIPELESNEAKLHFAPDRLHVLGEKIDPLTEVALRDYMEPVGPGFFKMTRSSFLKSCQTTGDVAEHIRQFRQRLPMELPPLWNEFFADLSQEPAVLKREGSWTVYSLPEKPEIRNAFMQDPTLRQHTLKVEGWRVAIEKSALAQVEKRLRVLGFFAR